MSTTTIVGQRGTYKLVAELPYWTGRSSSFYVIDQNRVYKRFATPRAGERARACLSGIVQVGAMPRSEMSPFFRKIAWPLDFVDGDGGVAGVVLPRADESYFDDSAGLDMGPRPLANLMSADAGPVHQRLLIVADLAAAFLALEWLDLVHGDLSENNATWRLAPEPALLVLDCDGLRRTRDPPRGEATDGWRDPRLDAGIVHTHDRASDRWALGLVVWRVLVADLNATPPGADFAYEGAWPPLLVPLLRQTFVDRNSADRPAPKTWYPALRDTARDHRTCGRFEALLADLRAGRPPHRPKRPPKPGPGTAPAPSRSRLPAVLAVALIVAAIPIALLFALEDRGQRVAGLAPRVPGGIDDCESRTTGLPAGAQARFVCSTGGRRRVRYVLFEGRAALKRYFRASRAAHPLVGDAPRRCPGRTGAWKRRRNGRTRGRYAVSPRRITWTDNRKRLVAVLIDPTSTTRVCTIWKNLPT